jgi:hypothetical protein
MSMHRDPASRGLGMTSQRARDRLVERLQAEGIKDRRVLDVIRQLPRHLFIDEALASRAYEDTALPIGQGQTISQPWVVARMTEALIEHGMPKRVLEIGTGSGYQCAVLAQLVEKVYTVERIEELLRNARRMFRKVGPWYSKRFGPANEFNKRIVQLSNKAEFYAILESYLAWRKQFLDETGELKQGYRPAPLVASFMQEPDVAKREVIPVPRGPVEVW